MDNPFLTDAVLLQKVADIVAFDVNTAPPRWVRIVSDANSKAYQYIQNKLMARGFLAGQIDSWVGGTQYCLDMGTYWALIDGGGLHSYDSTFIKFFDRTKDLDSVMVPLPGGPPQQPADIPAAVGHGTISTPCRIRREAWEASGEGVPTGGYLYGNPPFGLPGYQWGGF